MKGKIAKRDIRNGGVKDKNVDKMKSGMKGPLRTNAGAEEG